MTAAGRRAFAPGEVVVVAGYPGGLVRRRVVGPAAVSAVFTPPPAQPHVLTAAPGPGPQIVVAEWWFNVFRTEAGAAFLTLMQATVGRIHPADAAF